MKNRIDMIERESTLASSEAASNIAETPRVVSFAEALRFWVKLGFISFGGPAGQIAIMHQELVKSDFFTP